ncbi:hypothetical protein, partial [Mesobacillus zeae]
FSFQRATSPVGDFINITYCPKRVNTFFISSAARLSATNYILPLFQSKSQDKKSKKIAALFLDGTSLLFSVTLNNPRLDCN